MNKSKLTGLLFVLLGALIILGSAYAIISYASGLLGAIVDFVTTNDFTKLQQCGVNTPTEFQKLKTEFTSIILPSLYIGLPLLLILLSFLMFLGGFYYHKGRHQDETEKYQDMEREMLRKAVTKLEKRMPPPKEGEAEASEPEEAEEMEEDEPTQASRPRRKK